MSPVSTVRGLLWQCPAEPRLLFDSTDYSPSFLPKSEFFLGWEKSRDKKATVNCPLRRTQLIFYGILRIAAQIFLSHHRVVVTWNSVVSSASTEKMWIFCEKNNISTTIFKGLPQTFRASCSHSFSCQLKLNSSQCEHEYHIFSLFSPELVLLSRALLQKWAMPLIL